jgi:chaperonin GroES
MQIKPLADHVLLEPLKEEQKTKTGILLPETAEQERSEQGTVIAVGPGKKGKDGKITPVEVKVGDLVLFSKYGPNEVKVEGKEYLIAEEKDILAVLEKTTD